jgi:DNA (cytosine-5)-methyltransferase 1
MKFLEIIHNDFLNKIGSSKLLQELYESQMSLGATLEPTKLIEELGLIINDLEVDDDYFFQNGQEIFKGKSKVPLKQLYALYAINLVVTFANKS